MEFILNYYPILIPLAPFLAAVYSALPSRRADDRTYSVGVFAHVVAVVVAIVTLCQVATTGDVATRLVICETPWSFLPTIELSIDRLSAVMMMVIASIVRPPVPSPPASTHPTEPSQSKTRSPSRAAA